MSSLRRDPALLVVDTGSGQPGAGLRQVLRRL